MLKFDKVHMSHWAWSVSSALQRLRQEDQESQVFHMYHRQNKKQNFVPKNKKMKLVSWFYQILVFSLDYFLINT